VKGIDLSIGYDRVKPNFFFLVGASSSFSAKACAETNFAISVATKSIIS
jgi:predicted acyltransferase